MPTKVSQKKRLAAIVDKRTGILQVQSPVNGSLVRDATHKQTAKRQLDATSESDPLPAKRARLTPTGAQRPGVEAEHTDKTASKYPEPKPLVQHRNTSIPKPKVEGQEQVSPTTRLQRGQIDSNSDDNRPQLKRSRLTRANLALFNKMARKKASNNAEMQPDSADEPMPKTISTTSSGFAIRARDNGILEPLMSKPPTNLEEINKRYAGSRGTASPTESEHTHYVKKLRTAGNEATMVFETGQQLLKTHGDKVYSRALNRAFTAFPTNVGFNNGLSDPRPDFIEGLEMEEFRPFPVGDHVDGAVLYDDNLFSITLPHLAGEWRGPNGNIDQAGLQASYDGAALVYARNQALSYIGKPDPPGHAKITTFATDGKNVDFFAHYAAPSEDGIIEYHQYQYASANIKSTLQGHKDGRRGIRNAQDYAREQSYILKDQLKEHWKQHRGVRQPTAEGNHLDDIPEGTRLDGIPEEPLPAQEGNPCPDDDGEVEEPRPAKPTRHKRASRNVPAARRTDDVADTPSHAPAPPRSSEGLRRSARLATSRKRSAG